MLYAMLLLWDVYISNFFAFSYSRKIGACVW